MTRAQSAKGIAALRGRKGGLEGAGDVLLQGYSRLPEGARGAVVHQFLDKTGYLIDTGRTDGIMRSKAEPFVKAYLGQVNVQGLLTGDPQFNESVTAEITRCAWVAGGAFILGLIIR